MELTLVADGRVATVPAVACDSASGARSFRLSPATVASTLGFELKPQGLCRGDLCIPTGTRPDLVSESGVDLAVLADLLDRPLALDVAEGVAVLAESSARRAGDLRSLDAPEIELPDLDGRPHALSEYRGRKVFLLAFASW